MKYGFILCFLEVGEHKYANVQVIQTTDFKVDSTSRECVPKRILNKRAMMAL